MSYSLINMSSCRFCGKCQLPLLYRSWTKDTKAVPCSSLPELLSCNVSRHEAHDAMQVVDSRVPQKVTPLTPTSPLQSIPASAIAGGYRSRAVGEHAADDPLAPRNTIMQVNLWVLTSHFSVLSVQNNKWEHLLRSTC